MLVDASLVSTAFTAAACGAAASLEDDRTDATK
jgi:hypothetical protein